MANKSCVKEQARIRIEEDPVDFLKELEGQLPPLFIRGQVSEALINWYNSQIICAEMAGSGDEIRLQRVFHSCGEKKFRRYWLRQISYKLQRGL